MELKLNKSQQLEHRIAMIKDDLDIVIKFIRDNQLEEAFKKESETADECWTNISNIEIACDLSSDESLSWKSYSK